MTTTDLLPIANHLWQSTLFVVVVWLVALMLRKNRAAVRHRLWLAASIKFLIPFSVLISIGSHFSWRASSVTPPPAVSIVIGGMGEPFAVAQPSVPSRIPAVLFWLWVIGAAANIAWWFVRWLQLRQAMRRATSLKVNASIPVMSCAQRLEPGVFGIWKPVLMLPEGIKEALSPPQFQTVIAHELGHVRRRDNLAASIHLFVEALYWFHPLVWWIKTRLIEEQERACDEEVIGLGNDPQVYAETILKLCELYLTTPLICVAGMTSSDLKKRIEQIMSNRVPKQLSLSRQALLTVTLILVLAAPVMIGAVRPKEAGIAEETSTAVSTPPQGPQTPQATAGLRGQNKRSAPQLRDTYLPGLGNVLPSATVSVKSRIEGQLMAVSFNEGDRVQAGQLLASIDSRPFQIQLEQAQAQLSADQTELARARSSQTDATQLEAKIAASQANVNTIRLQMAYSEIRSPITGIAGLRLIDPGNVVRPSDNTPIVVITQLQPVAVLFTVPEDMIPEVRALLRRGSPAIVQAWNRDNSAKLATGRLIAADNQIDNTTGTVKLKAIFDNKDNALYPNQFVNVRLLLN